MDEVHATCPTGSGGAVWEEVIIHLPADVRLVSLSATVSNAEEFAEWLVTVRGHTRVIVEEHRPVPLWQHVDRSASGWSTCSTDDGEVNPHLDPAGPRNPSASGSAAWPRPGRGRAAARRGRRAVATTWTAPI